ncbi:MAG: MFS transporter [Nocardioidaceae bacterium]
MGQRTALRQRILVAVVQVLALATWFSASVVVPSLQVEWGISLSAAVWLTASTQIGFVVGAVASALTNLADRFHAPRLLGASAAGAATCTALLALLADSMASAVPLRFLTGVCLAGVYPVGMKLMASWAPTGIRGTWFGVLIGALALGSNLPHVIRILDLPWRSVLLAAAGVTLVGALVCVTSVRTGPHVDSRRPRLDPRYVTRMFRDPAQRLVNIGYFGHMWELYALWTWFSAFVLAGTAAGGADPGLVSLGVFVAMGAAGLVGCLVGGWSADRVGRAPTAIVALSVSGACSLLSPLFFLAPWGLLLGFAVVWGASVIADSGVFSTMLSEVAESAYAGTALTAQTAIGFLLTVVTIQAVPVAAGLLGWQWAFLVLVPGPVVGVAALARTQRHRRVQAA